MCGRIAQSDPSRYAERLGAIFPEPAWQPSWNVAPTARLLGVRLSAGGRTMGTYRWGLLPGWCDDPNVASRCFNARAESVATKPMFRAAFRGRRLLVPVDGFYEWRSVPGSTRKQPYFFQRADGEPLVLAGLWEWWARDGDQRCTATVLTTGAGPDMPIHDRQPVVLEPEDWARWLDPSLSDTAALGRMLRASPGVLVHHPVAFDVGSARNDGAHLVEPVPAGA